MIREEHIEFKRITEKKVNKRDKREGSPQSDKDDNVDDLSGSGFSDNKQPERAPERKKVKLISLKSDPKGKEDDIDTSKEEDDDSDY